MKYLLTTADDFGRSYAVNEAIEAYHEAGTISQASLMVNEANVEEAVRIARRNPHLCVGLHLTLCDGRAARLSEITDRTGQLVHSPTRAGMAAAFDRNLSTALSGEIERQFSAFAALGFAPTYWDGHHHLHLHPRILELTIPIAHHYGFRMTRVVREPFPFRPIPLVFRLLSRKAIPTLEQHGIHFTDRVYGLSHSGRMDATRVNRILRRLPDGWSEIYLHPGAERALPDPDQFGLMLQGCGARLCTATDLVAAAPKRALASPTVPA
jgi:hopanoid biosynthesis associated protein HpnK